MSDIITGIMIKNMAREMVKRATAKNVNLTVKQDFTWRGTKIKAGAPVEKKDGDYFVKPSYFSSGSTWQHDATYYGCHVAKDNVDGV